MLMLIITAHALISRSLFYSVNRDNKRMHVYLLCIYFDEPIYIFLDTVYNVVTSKFKCMSSATVDEIPSNERFDEYILRI